MRCVIFLKVSLFLVFCPGHAEEKLIVVTLASGRIAVSLDFDFRNIPKVVEEIALSSDSRFAPSLLGCIDVENDDPVVSISLAPYSKNDPVQSKFFGRKLVAISIREFESG